MHLSNLILYSQISILNFDIDLWPWNHLDAIVPLAATWEEHHETAEIIALQQLSYGRGRDLDMEESGTDDDEVVPPIGDKQSGDGSSEDSEEEVRDGGQIHTKNPFALLGSDDDW